MKRKWLSLAALALAGTLLLMGCGNGGAQSGEGKLRVWGYLHPYENIHDLNHGIAKTSLETFAEEKGIELQFTEHSEETLSYEDYVLKRNIAINNGEVDLVLDTSIGFEDIRHVAADYTQLKAANEIKADLSDVSCIPLVYSPPLFFIDNSLLEEYQVSADEVQTIEDYYIMKDKLKSAGALFELNYFEIWELTDSYLRRDNIYEKFKSQDPNVRSDVETTVNAILQEIDKNYSGQTFMEADRITYDLKTKKELYDPQGSLAPVKLDFNPQMKTHTPVFLIELDTGIYEGGYKTPAVFLPNNGNDIGIEAADYLLSSEVQVLFTGYSEYNNGNIPVNYNKEVLQKLNLDENLNLISSMIYNEADAINQMIKMSYQEMEEHGLEYLMQYDFEAEFVQRAVVDIIIHVKKNGYDQGYVQNQLDKLINDYKLYYTKK